MTSKPAKPTRLLFRKAHRLTKALEFQAAYSGKVMRVRGPLVVYARRNALATPRLGLSVSRKVGGAVKRNRIKRLLREAFRLDQFALPAGVDLVINVRPHDTLELDEYRRLLLDAATSLARHLPPAPKAAPENEP